MTGSVFGVATPLAGCLLALCFLLNNADAARQRLLIEPPAPHVVNETAKGAYLFSPRRSDKFPIMRPKLRTTTRAPTPPPTTPRQENLQVKRQAVLDTVLKQADIFELSSSDFSPAVAWPVPRRPASRRFRPNALPPPSTARPLLKLRQPKPTRPPAYSLDGFVPKPSIIRVSSTEAPPHIRKQYAAVTTEPAAPFRKNSAPRFGSKRTKSKPLTNDYDDDGHFRKPRKYQDTNTRKNVQRVSHSRGPRKGIPGIDYPNFHRIPSTGFDCNEKQFPGMYADTDAGCQVWHMCTGVPNLGARHSFLCPNGTIFNERRGVCDWWYNVECSEFGF